MTTNQEKRQRKNERSRFKRRSDRLLEYGDEFGKLFDSKVYLLVQSQEGDLTIYNNRSENEWPPSQSEFPGPSEHRNPQNIGQGGRRPRSKFEKKKVQLLSYANEFAHQFSAKIYFAIQCRTGYTIIYNSSSSRRWPPSKKQVKSLVPFAKRRSPQDFDGSPDLPSGNQPTQLVGL
ncbi:uncharacterized protein ATNIH1004_001884 [Aspergillus tanneri]|uniref:MADS-box domain-containing protein n=1 Tax=Aspergillus tanneri TaxID=1220188 RepID=A0A5M9MA46_9EURO|nr:uncharacterized protein ATNIH1004_001884 [Aspergillus tanneri]KAA8641419.1 hypothetical protein ATNIH1004_001884 [Aspergillus tanneri]